MLSTANTFQLVVQSCNFSPNSYRFGIIFGIIFALKNVRLGNLVLQNKFCTFLPIFLFFCADLDIPRKPHFSLYLQSCKQLIVADLCNFYLKDQLTSFKSFSEKDGCKWYLFFYLDFCFLVLLQFSINIANSRRRNPLALLEAWETYCSTCYAF